MPSKPSRNGAIAALLSLIVFPSAIQASPIAREVVADFDGDGLPDTYYQSLVEGEAGFFVFTRHGDDGIYGVRVPAQDVLGIGWDAQAHLAHGGDFNGDGRADLLQQQNRTAGNYVYSNADNATRFELIQSFSEEHLGMGGAPASRSSTWVTSTATARTICSCSRAPPTCLSALCSPTSTASSPR